MAGVLIIAITLWSWRLRADPGGQRGDDLLYVALGVIPGALVGGRLFHALSFLDAYTADPSALFDLSRGALSLVGAVLGGAASGAYVARLLGRPLGTWADAAAVPMLVAIGLGKVALLVGGSGQGAALDAPWAVAFLGSGPWISSDPGVAAHPSQVYEGALVLLGLLVVPWLARRRDPRPAGFVFLAALAWWLAARSVVSFTWRDAAVIGPLGVEAALTLVAFIGVAIVLGRILTRPSASRTRSEP